MKLPDAKTAALIAAAVVVPGGLIALGLWLWKRSRAPAVDANPTKVSSPTLN